MAFFPSVSISWAADQRQKNMNFFFYKLVTSIDLFRGACAVKGNVQVAGHVKRVDHGDAFNA